MNKILVFAGTQEGRCLCEELQAAGIDVHVSVATAYGAELMIGKAEKIYAGRLGQEEMAKLICSDNYQMVVDATHPYAQEVTKELQAVCNSLGKEYLRLVRTEGETAECLNFASYDEIVAFLNVNSGNVLATIGSKELARLTAIKNYQERIYARILPLVSCLEKAIELGFTGKQLICMQGPFSTAMNMAQLKDFECSYLLTKDTGDIGGLQEKIEAATLMGARVLLLERPMKEEGFSLAEIVQRCKKSEKHQYFPFFQDITAKKVLVVGGGQIASRRVQSLVQFACQIQVVGKSLSSELQALALDGAIIAEEREFKDSDLEGAFCVIAATDDRGLNEKIGKLAREQGKYVSVADCKEECNFFFPALVLQSELVVGITSEGKKHGAVKKTAAVIRSVLRDEN